MSANRTNAWLRASGPPLKWVVWIFAALLCGSVAAPAQQNDQLEQELQQLRQQYDQTTRDLQQRISVLEQQLENQRAGLEHQIAEQAANKQTQKLCAARQTRWGQSFKGNCLPLLPMTC